MKLADVSLSEMAICKNCNVVFYKPDEWEEDLCNNCTNETSH